MSAKYPLIEKCGLKVFRIDHAWSLGLKSEYKGEATVDVVRAADVQRLFAENISDDHVVSFSVNTDSAEDLLREYLDAYDRRLEKNYSQLDENWMDRARALLAREGEKK